MDYRRKCRYGVCSSQRLHSPRRAGPAIAGIPWFQDRAHGKFTEAIKTIDVPQAADAVCVAHLDTGYDPNHATLPANLAKPDSGLQRNFVDDDRPNDASYDSEGLLNNIGHGTGTLSILAGKALPGSRATGAAPFVKVVPIRVANRVVLFYTNAVARGLGYVHRLCADPTTRVHVVTMSMGGLASEAWAEAINAL
jgi:subtilisin family serine protease